MTGTTVTYSVRVTSPDGSTTTTDLTLSEVFQLLRGSKDRPSKFWRCQADAECLTGTARIMRINRIGEPTCMP